ncbi:MAG: biotin--[acetyl-CoA-carboxylase] ligase [Neisseriaceae bacterium]|nr:biotin--[acetyl-CoA-carboxylase] ligase [Neisseriaceae bacterium]
MKQTFWAFLSLISDGKPHAEADLLAQLAVDADTLQAYLVRAQQELAIPYTHLNQVIQLTRPMTVLSEDLFAQTDVHPALSLQVLDECTSTNTLLFQRAKDIGHAVHGHVLVTNQQTQGRGRQGRSWYSAIGGCLPISLAWAFDQKQAQLSHVPLLVALACHRVLTKLHVPCQIKWPNDVMAGEAKMGGILVESMPTEQGSIVVIGVGLNLIAPYLPQQKTLGLWDVQPSIDPSQVVSLFLNELATILQAFTAQGAQHLMPEYMLAHRDQNKEVELWANQVLIHQGVVQGIAEDGALLLQTPHGLERIHSGEVSLRRPQRKLLLLDAGNSQLKWTIVEKGKFTHHDHAPYRDLAALSTFMAAHPDVHEVIGCAVCGTHKREQVEALIPFPVKWLPSQRHAMGIYNHYQNPQEHGSDRWFNILGSRVFTQNSAIIASCGTAITIDALTHNNHYLGGSIMPGFNLMREAMSKRTANLNRQLGRPYAFATSTPNAMASGIMDAAVGSILGAYQRLKAREGADHPVDIIITGGSASRVLEHVHAYYPLPVMPKVVDNLVFHGLLNWIEHS